ncbi:MAG: hypothetical protein A2275_09580 [Bacteroidetes bacterium RIFOXYA12_FULL_35_11]|nr:MAG: hypothetical protein A2X01_17545 [Bacteroidetes bacterium GWF2_35_48]OFY74525.1 MAG: hypothetical protein A2275_09580 [Bacteroidetes bacterium RIFOXYA12_FULL_35_11]OFY94324.1 MAG: hypothetical protein A2491_00655 [Bacteroidetes bacterium RIFOXYC12_FULL_35_7]OFY97686.1 MAG: hypothetical protein A2309_03255 [Bacteroidetes bacterium RIFOXYB2_FULL_35_7]HBX49636.1 hypothetical protein [Bacteroidales bacterium]
MKNLLILFCLTFLLFFSGCIQFFDDWLRTSDIEYKRTAVTKSFSKEFASFELSQLNNEFNIKFEWKKPKDFQFPVHPETGDTLHAASFRLTFYKNKKNIPVNISHISSKEYDWALDSLNFILETKPTSIFYGYQNTIKIPMYLFHSLKAGKHEITMELSQTKFVYSNYKNKYAADKVPELSACEIKGSLTFQLTIPEIRQSVFYMNGLELQNDSVWSPIGMDFYIWGNGYPEVYWQVFYPVLHERDLSHPIHRSTETFNTTNWVGHDTINFYHYSDNEKIIIGVYDYDMLSRNDWIGDWYGPVQSLVTRRGANKRISFDHVAWFEVRIESLGIINR